jgi:hypothetical protein
MITLLGVSVFAVFGVVFSAEQSNVNVNAINAELTKALLNMDDYSWDALGDEAVPLEQQEEEVLGLLYQLVHVVPPSFLKQNVSKPFPNFSALVNDPVQFRGLAFELKGNVELVREISLNPAEQKRFRIPSIFRCRFRVDAQYVGTQHVAEILTAFVPAAWKRNEPISERSAVTGIYLKRLVSGNVIADPIANPITDPIADQLEFHKFSSNESDFIPFIVASRVQWFPETFLGDIGFDVGSFDQVPAFRIADLKKQKQFDVVPSLQFLSRNEIIHRAFKLTESDREPFYGLLQAALQTTPNQIRQEAHRILEQEGEKKMSAIELFNNPKGMRGKPVLLHGIAKQVLPTLVEDKEVNILFGIKKYYQIYFYTNDSQGNPLVACVTSLPDGMPVGSSPDYAEKITIAAIPYKLWVYESSAKLEGGNGYKPNYAPLLIGKSLSWHQEKKSPKTSTVNNEIQNTRTTISITLFFLLLLIWFIIKRFQNKRTIKFRNL